MIETWIVSLILLAIAAGIIGYLVRSKKKGAVCVGCPYAKQCSGKCGSYSGNMNGVEEKK